MSPGGSGGGRSRQVGGGGRGGGGGGGAASRSDLNEAWTEEHVYPSIEAHE